MQKLPTSVFSYSHDSWSQLLKFYEESIAEVVQTATSEPVEETFEELVGGEVEDPSI